MFFQGEVCTAWAVFRVSKTTKIKKKGMVFRPLKIRDKEYVFLVTINTGLGYDFESISLIRV